MQEMPGHPASTHAVSPAIILDGESGQGLAAAREVTHRLRRHREMLVASILILAIAFLLQVRKDDQVAPALFPNCPLPSTCLSRSLFGIDCPGCGLTRSFVLLAHGDWQASLARHRLGWLLAVAVALQIPYRLTGLLRRNKEPLGRRIPKLFGLALIAALIGNWLLRLMGV
jgi:hypothetical protein